MPGVVLWLHALRVVLLPLMAFKLVETLLQEGILVDVHFVHHLRLLNQGPALPLRRKWTFRLLLYLIYRVDV